jgi:hypothetical protein
MPACQSPLGLMFYQSELSGRQAQARLAARKKFSFVITGLAIDAVHTSPASDYCPLRKTDLSFKKIVLLKDKK